MNSRDCWGMQPRLPRRAQVPSVGRGSRALGGLWGSACDSGAEIAPGITPSPSHKAQPGRGVLGGVRALWQRPGWWGGGGQSVAGGSQAGEEARKRGACRLHSPWGGAGALPGGSPCTPSPFSAAAAESPLGRRARGMAAAVPATEPGAPPARSDSRGRGPAG